MPQIDITTTLMVFLGGVLYIALNTLRLILIAKGHRWIAPFLGIVEVLLFLFSVKPIFSQTDHLEYALAYAFGFGVGISLGMYLEQKLAMGYVLVRVITLQDASGLLDALRQRQFAITVIAAQGLSGEVRILFSIIRRRHLEHFLETVQEIDQTAFISTEDVRHLSSGYLANPKGISVLPLGT